MKKLYPRELFLDGTGGSNRITIPEDTVFSFHIYITSIQQSGNNAKSSETVGLIRRQNGGNATIVGQHTDGNKTFNDGGFNPSYTISADTSNQALKIDVTGIAATNIHTVAVVNVTDCLLYTSPSPRDRTRSRMPSSA